MTDEAAWQTWRRGGTTASDIARAKTGKYGGRVGVVADKLGYGQDDIDPYLADRGHQWEQPIADAVLAVHGLYVHGEQTLAQHPDRPEDRATLDGFLHPEPEASIDDIDDLLEVKTRSLMAPWPWEYAYFQTQWQLHVTGMRRALIVVATIDELVGIVRIDFQWHDRDDHVIETLVAEADELWAHVQAGTLPEPTDGSTLAVIKAANATAAPYATAEIDAIAEIIADYDDLKARAKAADDALKLGESRIRIAIGEATEATTTDGRWRVRVGEPISKFTRDSEADALALHPEYGKTVLDRERFKAEHPDLYDQLRRPTPDRRMTIKEMT